MASATEDAIAAVVATLAAAAAIDGAPFPPPLRNEVLPTRIPVFGAIGMFVNVLDGDGRVDSAALGDDADVPLYELVQSVQIELIVEAADRAEREVAFDAALTGLHDALRQDRTLGGRVSYNEISAVSRNNLNTDGLPQMKAAVITLDLSFLSTRPF